MWERARATKMEIIKEREINKNLGGYVGERKREREERQ